MIVIEKTSWFNRSGLSRTTQWLKDDAVSLTGYVNGLAETPGDPEAMKAIDEAHDALNAALLAVKLARSTYRKTVGKKLALVAAE